jgi:hypothetical protein
VPVAREGASDEANLVTLCEPCQVDEHHRAEDDEIEEIGGDYLLYGEV